MSEWIVRIALLLICIGLFAYAYHLTKSRDEIEEELYRHIRDHGDGKEDQ